jgi:hypothetical protein
MIQFPTGGDLRRSPACHDLLGAIHFTASAAIHANANIRLQQLSAHNGRPFPPRWARQEPGLDRHRHTGRMGPHQRRRTTSTVPARLKQDSENVEQLHFVFNASKTGIGIHQQSGR